MADDSSGEKSQAPTGKRLENAREEGNIAQSREVQLLIVLSGFLIVFTTSTGLSAYRFTRHMYGLMAHFDSIPFDRASLYRASVQASLEGVWLAAPLVGTALLVTLAFGVVQSGFLFRPQAIMPDITRLSPAKGISRIFSKNNLVETAKSLIKLVVFGCVLFGVAKETLRVAPVSERWSVRHLTSELISWFVYATLVVLVVQAVIAVLDDVWTRWNRLQKLRMSFQEIKDETKEMDGDPKVKARQRQMRMRRRRRMVQAVRDEATVVITNPTHYAVALQYENGVHTAPKIVAKGTDELAARMREAAEEARIPIVPNPPLARALYTLPLDSEIPAEYFQPVATIIAYVMKLKTPGARAVTPPPQQPPPPRR
ncbi:MULTISPECIES: EscU/YscU/HrcU family type III secretion system export apparatus switch protein [Acetobacter]|jgi:flagellar biosynthetic protein FlhB|uniref:Flagellar biosynthetic protein FlhB n=4 Tax=Acetobacter TaxID=434 RepID=A0A841QFM3_9PROT|nr:flagellar type III secretion system protein FlhB [Acetobacter lovaniensis]MBB6457175.1 flagellar biosynthetic protein FlhB [Acetobacter lovaniensis]MCI1697755.1 flagellar type III secretion system protein FlhB [Acetobacter lovaniensis]MCI1795896.1 flagellar type III secretion system protein FlhB [Acetobacter lovaniensis]MCP1239483.1 flagellar type III secretion system protein FlhB [Acetobacter lovaniensis]NHN81245.1 flagellar type III secretion system protein FlhB [Acetobacter lovaniensis]